MEPPSDDRRAEQDSERPDFDSLDDPADVVRNGRTREQVYSTVLQLDEPATVAEIADRAGPGTDATREYLRWFADMGLVSQVTERPERYEVNHNYLRWRRANRLSENYREAEIVQRLQDVTEEIQRYRDEFDVRHPDDVDIRAVADDGDEDVADVWKTVSAWETAEGRRDVLADALDMARGNSQSTGGGGSSTTSELEV
jgi:hypothetical protein